MNATPNPEVAADKARERYPKGNGQFEALTAITSSKTASTAEWPLMSLILTRVVLPWTGRSAVIARAWA